jgi:mannose-6-phosphate isomerase-like protein (cupin superfamily)
MKKVFTLSFFISMLVTLSVVEGFSQNFQSLDTVKAVGEYENILVRKLYSDSLVSSFVIFIKHEVKAHKHVSHSEHVYVLDGEGEMSLGANKFSVKKGDMVFIPKGTVHSLTVTSKMPAKVVSVQAPMFDGKDRVMAEEKK